MTTAMRCAARAASSVGSISSCDACTLSQNPRPRSSSLRSARQIALLPDERRDLGDLAGDFAVRHHLAPVRGERDDRRRRDPARRRSSARGRNRPPSGCPDGCGSRSRMCCRRPPPSSDCGTARPTRASRPRRPRRSSPEHGAPGSPPPARRRRARATAAARFPCVPSRSGSSARGTRIRWPAAGAGPTIASRARSTPARRCPRLRPRG